MCRWISSGSMLANGEGLDGDDEKPPPPSSSAVGRGDVGPPSAIDRSVDGVVMLDGSWGGSDGAWPASAPAAAPLMSSTDGPGAAAAPPGVGACALGGCGDASRRRLLAAPGRRFFLSPLT